MVEKYGKSYKGIRNIKEKFITQNREYLQEYDRIAGVYRSQQLREKCKVCGTALNDDLDCFVSHDIKYCICDCCGHVNGIYKDTEEFVSNLSVFTDIYQEDSKEKWNQRKNAIYKPKADFMLEALKTTDFDVSNAKFLDVGAGSGYFVGALLDKGINAIGIEISGDQVDYGNRILGKKAIIQMEAGEVNDTIRNTECSVVSFIGVFEHIIDLNSTLESIKLNPNIRFVYFMVPMFSFSVMWEAVNSGVLNRHLGGGHTHLFTDESLSYLYNKCDWSSVAEWRFGTDAADLMRTITVKLYNEGNDFLAQLFEEKFSDGLDDIQLIMDKMHFCTEIHALVEKNDYSRK